MQHRHASTPRRPPTPAKQAPRQCGAQPSKLCSTPALQGEAVADLQLDDCVAHGAGGFSARPAGSSKRAKFQGSLGSGVSMTMLHTGQQTLCQFWKQQHEGEISRVLSAGR